MNHPEPFTGATAAWALGIIAFAVVVIGVAVFTHSIQTVAITIFLILFSAVVLAIIENGQGKS